MNKPKPTAKEKLANLAMGAYIGFGITLVLASMYISVLSK